MHQSSEILKPLGGVPQECLKQSEIFSVQIQWKSLQALLPKNNRHAEDTVGNKWMQIGYRLIYSGRG
jgi:hypothetical protein